MSRLEKAIGRKITAADKAKNDARIASLRREMALTPNSEVVADSIVRSGEGTKVYKDPVSGRWTKRRPEIPNPAWRVRYRCNDGAGRMSKAAALVQEAYTPAWREGTNRALGNPVPTREQPVAKGTFGLYPDHLREKACERFCPVCDFPKANCEGHE